MKNSTFTNNSIDDYGGAINSSHSTVTNVYVNNELTISDSNINGHYDIVNNLSIIIQAINNYWGTIDELSIHLSTFIVLAIVMAHHDLVM